MQYVAGNPWSDKDKRERLDRGRPALAFDELGQYLNQYINNLRENKRAIKIDPRCKARTIRTQRFSKG